VKRGKEFSHPPGKRHGEGGKVRKGARTPGFVGGPGIFVGGSRGVTEEKHKERFHKVDLGLGGGELVQKKSCTPLKMEFLYRGFFFA